MIDTLIKVVLLLLMAVVGKLLSLIQIKYGGVKNAEGTKEFSELQKWLNAEGS